MKTNKHINLKNEQERRETEKDRLKMNRLVAESRLNGISSSYRYH